MGYPDGGSSSLTADDVAWLYESLLARRPSSDEIDARLSDLTRWQDLVATILASEEYRSIGERAAALNVDLEDPRVNIWHPDLARFAHAPGAMSTEGDAVMGKLGWIFLTRGSNSVLDQHQPEFELPVDWTDRWRELIGVRRDDSASLGASLAMVVVPDKLSAMSAYLPDEISLMGTPPAARLAAMAELDVIFPVDELAGVESGAYLRTDTHLALAGNSVLAARVLDSLLLESAATVAPDFPTVTFLSCGELGRRFSPPVLEVLTTYNSYGAAAVVEDNHAEIRAAGRHLGTRRVLRNDAAPDRRTAVVFGDSYAFPVPHYQGLAWHLAQHFAEVHFVWSPFGWDRGYVERAGAEVVVCEMAERFVPRPPDVRTDVAKLAAEATS